MQNILTYQRPADNFMLKKCVSEGDSQNNLAV